MLVVTPLLTPQIVMALRRLHSLGKSIILVSVDHRPPASDSRFPFAVYHVPPMPSFWNGTIWTPGDQQKQPRALELERIASQKERV
jgi:hypothetical protein